MSMGTLKLGENMEIKVQIIKEACSMAMKAHESPEKQYLSKKISSSEVVFSFPGSWSVNDWLTESSFGEMKVDLQLFPSLKYIGLDETATVNQLFLKRFKALLANSQLKDEVGKAVTERKQVLFAGHSLGGAIAKLATIWFLELYIRQDSNCILPLCLTFGSPLVGDRIINHALRRENWSHRFVSFVMRFDIVPRISLSPSSFIEQQLQQVLDFFNNPKVKQEPPNEAPGFYATVMKNASSVASYDACKMMGSTNSLLETVSSFIELSPYRPLGTYVFCTGNRKLVVISSTDAVLQVLFYSSQLSNGDEIVKVAQTSLRDHFKYVNELQECLQMPSITHLYLRHPEAIPSSSNNANVDCMQFDEALNDLGLSEKARLCLRAAETLENQKLKNQATIDEKQKDIEKCLKKLEAYKERALRKVGYYDVFKSSEEKEDFHANVERLELAGIWDEIIEMLKRCELPDEFEGQKAWINLGTRYGSIVEPLDIANYYRHLKNEDTGPYMQKGRPKRYKCTQRWREHAEKLPNERIPGSCFWAEVEELCINTGPGIKQSILLLENKVQKWIQFGELDNDVLLENSTFDKLRKQHYLTTINQDIAFWS